MECIPWDFPAKLLRPNKAQTEVGTLRGCVRAWLRLAEIDQTSCGIHSREEMWIADWAGPLTIVNSIGIAQLSRRLDARAALRGV
jgi:hypothetical protein